MHVRGAAGTARRGATGAQSWRRTPALNQKLMMEVARRRDWRCTCRRSWSRRCKAKTKVVRVCRGPEVGVWLLYARMVQPGAGRGCCTRAWCMHGAPWRRVRRCWRREHLRSTATAERQRGASACTVAWCGEVMAAACRVPASLRRRCPNVPSRKLLQPRVTLNRERGRAERDRGRTATREHASDGHGGCRPEIWPEGPLPWMSSGAIWWRGWRRPWRSWSGGELDNGETTVANLAGGARRRQWRGFGTG
jgi:hypothetical protein